MSINFFRCIRLPLGIISGIGSRAHVGTIIIIRMILIGVVRECDSCTTTRWKRSSCRVFVAIRGRYWWEF